MTIMTAMMRMLKIMMMTLINEDENDDDDSEEDDDDDDDKDKHKRVRASLTTAVVNLLVGAASEAGAFPPSCSWGRYWSPVSLAGRYTAPRDSAFRRSPSRRLHGSNLYTAGHAKGCVGGERERLFEFPEL